MHFQKGRVLVPLIPPWLRRWKYESFKKINFIFLDFKQAHYEDPSNIEGWNDIPNKILKNNGKLLTFERIHKKHLISQERYF